MTVENQLERVLVIVSRGVMVVVLVESDGQDRHTGHGPQQ